MVVLMDDIRCHCIHFNNPSKKQWGFATQAPDCLTIPPIRSNIIGSRNSHSSSTISTAKARDGQFNHACIIYDKEEGNDCKTVGTSIADVTVVINLKLSDMSCHPFHKLMDWGEDGGVLLQDPDLAYGHGPIEEEVLGALKTVVPCLVWNNIKPKTVHILLLASQKCHFETSTCKSLHYVQGALHIPNCFNERFHYSISSSGGFDQYKQALVAYIHMLYYGAMQAIQST